MSTGPVIAAPVPGEAGGGPGPLVAQDSCELYPLAVSQAALTGVTAGQEITDIFNGTKPGNFGWLSWDGTQSKSDLVTSLTAPGDADSYVTPDDSSDHQVSSGDWVSSRTGVMNSKAVRDALDQLKTRDITIVLWDATSGQGSNVRYRVSGFIRARLTGYDLPNKSISARYLGPDDTLHRHQRHCACRRG